MKRFVRFSEKIQYLGLLGLPGLIFENRIFDFCWLFWLFGFVGIFYNFPVFLQSLKQLWGLLIIPLKYGSRLPNADSYQCKGIYALPFKDEWSVVNGGIDKTSSHSWGIPTQRYAYDFLMLDEEGKSFSGDRTKTTDYYCYDKEVLAPADGEVVEVRDEYSDSLLLGNGQVDCSARDIRGNYILIRHADREYGLLAHLKPGSILVKVGNAIKRGQSIARCGNSGNSSEPHLHFHLQDGVSCFTSVGLPIAFTDITAQAIPNYAAFDPRPTSLTATFAEKHIMRGQNVSNL